MDDAARLQKQKTERQRDSEKRTETSEKMGTPTLDGLDSRKSLPPPSAYCSPKKLGLVNLFILSLNPKNSFKACSSF